MNTLSLVGNIARDLETKIVGDNMTIVKTAIAVNKKIKGQDKTMFIDVTFFGKTAEVAARFVSKGDKIALSGSLELDQWEDNQGNKRSKHSMAVNQMTLIGGGKQAAQQQPQQQQEPTFNESDSIPF
jgi:single-strand DNA-binding protein